MSGMMTLAGDKEDPPNRAYGNQAYICGSIDGAAGTMMALYHRDLTGEGQHVDVSMQEALSINQETAMLAFDMTGRIATRTGARGLIPIDLPGIGIFPAKDGNVFCYLGTPGGAPWTTMVDWMQREGKAEDLLEGENLEMVQGLNLAFLIGARARARQAAGAHQGARRTCATCSRGSSRSYSKWYIYEEAQKQRLMIGIVSTPEDLAKNPQLEARKWYQDVPHDSDGAHRPPRRPAVPPLGDAVVAPHAARRSPASTTPRSSASWDWRRRNR